MYDEAPEIKTLSSWMNAIIEEINNMIKSFRGEMNIP